MECVFERTNDPNVVRCGNPGCTNVLRVPTADFPLERCHGTCLSGVPESERPNHLANLDRVRQPRRDTVRFPCVYLHGTTGETANCGGCGGGLRALFACDIFGSCLPWNVTKDYHCCLECDQYKPVGEAVS